MLTGRLNFDKMNGLIPAIIQDAESGNVLMTGFMDREALDLTINTKQVTFFSRTKKRLWKKRESSGNILDVVSVHSDCDNDSILILAHPRGPVCHTGKRTCFSPETQFPAGTLDRLSAIVQTRKKEMPENSYTARLFREGIARIAQKVGEEGVELAIAAQYQDRRRITEETADLFYHILVLLAEKQIDLASIFYELEGRMKEKSK